MTFAEYLTRRRLFQFGALALGLLTLSSAIFVLPQSQQAIIMSFGKPISENAITEPGLHLKLPFIQQVRYLDQRILDWDGAPSEISTRGREFILMDTTARWRIADPLRFIQDVRDESSAQVRLDDIIDSTTRDVVTESLLEEIVRSKDWEVPTPDSTLPEEAAVLTDTDLNRPARGRAELEREILTRAAPRLAEFGIELVDVRSRRVSYVKDVRERVENRMIVERMSVAERFKSEGEGRAREIAGETDREVSKIRSEAERTAQEIMGGADAKAARIYAQAYGADAEFYRFYQTLNTLRSVNNENSTLLIDSNSDFYRYLKHSGSK
jgi:modulator of FtsH protease HflC